MSKKQSIDLLINNPLNSIQPRQIGQRNPAQFGQRPGLVKSDSIHSLLR